MKPLISVIAPCLNESLNIPEFVSRIERLMKTRKLSLELILIDDGSTDNTKEVISQLKQPFIRKVFHDRNRGVEEGWRSGLANAHGTYVVIIDTDLQYQPEDIWRLYREITFSHTDLVQGYRSTVGRPQDIRYVLSIGLNHILNFLFGMRAHDNKSCLIITRREILEDIMNHVYRYYYFQTFLTVAAHAKGYTIREIEVIFAKRLMGSSFLGKYPFKTVLLSFVDIAKGFFEYGIVNRRDTFLDSYLSERKLINRISPASWWRKIYFWSYIATMPIHHWLISGDTGAYYKQLNVTQWLSPEEMADLQDRKLKRLINHAYQHVSYWRELFDRLKLDPSDITHVSDLTKLPLLSKDDIRKNLYFGLLSDNHDKKKMQKITTSGSTGEPFVCYVDRRQLEYRLAATYRSMEWTGWRFGDREMRLWHQTLGMSPMQVIKERLDALYTNRMFIPVFAMTDERMDRFIETLKGYRPKLMQGYAESFNLLAQYIKFKGGIGGVSPQAVMTMAQVLPPQSRKIIEKEFGCRVFDKYGSREFSGIAFECEAHRGHHVVAENLIVEILKNNRPAKPGEVGEIVITDLNNFCMPFIRYRIGDLGVAMDNSKSCRCGRGLPRIGAIEGRVQSIVMGANGTYLPGTFFSHLFKDYDYAIKQFHVEQLKPGHMNLYIVKGERFSDRIFSGIITTIREYLGETMEITVMFTDSIPLTRVGKRIGCLSKVRFDFQKLN